jgi:beta-N-acetylhexosaminidase
VTDRAILGRVMLAFDGETLPDWVAQRLAEAPAAGMTVFRHFNVRSPGQMRELMEAFQRAGAAVLRSAAGPMLVAADQEGGQLLALGDGPTAFAGNMALGAVGDADLAERVGEAVGREARAMGVNVVYAPVMDVATNPTNPALGIRSFGDDAAEVGRLGAAMVRGLQRAGVASGIKHFPGLGEAAVDTHHGVATVGGSRERMTTVELVPFRAGVEAGARLVMSAHVAAPALADGSMRPATLTRAVMTGVLRSELGFDGVSITDALDMGAIAQGQGQGADIIAAAQAGVDLFLCSPDRDALGRIEGTLVDAADHGHIDASAVAASLARVEGLRRWLGAVGPLPDLAVVGCAEHRTLSRELAERSMTLVRDDAGRLPLRLPADATILAVMPTPTDLTPADTSSVVAPGLARALRARHSRVEELVVPIAPGDADVAAALERAHAADLVVVGTIDSVRHPGQAGLVDALAATGTPAIAVALRTPWDVATYPGAVTAACTYSILPDSLDALAAALFGAIPFAGRLPVAVDGVESRASNSAR